MHFVFIVGSYYPNYSAVGKCVGNVAKVLSKNHKVTIICEKNYIEQNEEDKYENQRLLRIITRDKIIREQLTDKINKSRGMDKKLHIVKLFAYKITEALKLVYSKVSLKQDLVISYKSKLSEISEKIDVIVPASMPFESVVAAYQFKKEYAFEVAIIPYLFDQFVENSSLHRFKINKWLKRKKHRELEHTVIKSSKSVLIMKQLKYYFKENYSDYTNSVYSVEHPLISKINNVSNNEGTLLKFVYTGSFYKGVREPEYMLRLFNAIFNKVEGVFNLYTFGNCQNVIKIFATKNDSIKDNGAIPSSLVDDAIMRNHYLVAVGNCISNQVPSKIFEYLSFGKPIIYLYTLESDENIKVLSSYPFALCLKQDEREFESNLLKLLNFCKLNQNSFLPYEKVIQIFPDAVPEYTAELLERLARS